MIYREQSKFKEPIYLINFEIGNNSKAQLSIYIDSKPDELAYNFCKENNLDFESLQIISNKIKSLLDNYRDNLKILSNNKENFNSFNSISNNKNSVLSPFFTRGSSETRDSSTKKANLFYCEDPIIEVPEDSLSTDKKLKKNYYDLIQSSIQKVNLTNNFANKKEKIHEELVNEEKKEPEKKLEKSEGFNSAELLHKKSKLIKTINDDMNIKKIKYERKNNIQNKIKANTQKSIHKRIDSIKENIYEKKNNT